MWYQMNTDFDGRVKLLKKETVVFALVGSKMQKFGFINSVDKVVWPL